MHMATRARKTLLAELPAEDWGARMQRARERYAGLTQGEAIEAISRYHLADRSIIARLEAATEAPTTRSRRAVAYLLCLAYGLDPHQFELDDGDIPPGLLAALDQAPITPGGQGRASSRCTVLPLVRELVPAA